MVKEVLSSKIKMFSDQLYHLFEGFPNNIEQNAGNWSDAINTYINSTSSFITPTSSTAEIAKQSMYNVMRGLEEPVIEDLNALPFTLYYKSPEYRMRVFNLYLKNKANYIPNPNLDKTEVFTRLKIIREQYNRLYPSIAFSEDDIFYNQRRFNEIYANDIKEGTVIKLKSDGYTTDSLVELYQNIPVDPNGKIIPLQVDGIIGDDTIRYLPKIEGSIVSVLNDNNWNKAYKQIELILNPKVSGEVDSAIFPVSRGNDVIRKFVTTAYVRKNFIDTKKIKDYTTITLDTTQNKTDDGLSKKAFPNDIYVDKTMTYFIKEFERRHVLYDNLWIKNKITSIVGLKAYNKKSLIEYNSKPELSRDGVKLLELAITTYATQLAIGMSPAFTAAPSQVPLNLKSVALLGLSGANNKECVNLMVNLINTYFKGGTAVNNTSGVLINWI